MLADKHGGKGEEGGKQGRRFQLLSLEVLKQKLCFLVAVTFEVSTRLESTS